MGVLSIHPLEFRSDPRTRRIEIGSRHTGENPPAVPAHLNSSTFQSDLLATRRSILRTGALGLRDAHGSGQGEVPNPHLQWRRAEPH